MADHLYTYENPCAERDLERIWALVDAGGVIAYPSDLNWAFGCDAENVKAIDRIRALKPGKAKEQPFSLVCDSISMAAQLCSVDNFAYPLLKKNLPGPYTILFERHRSLARQLKDKRRVVGIKIPESELIRSLVTRLGRPLVTTSVPHRVNGEPFRFGYEVFDVYGHALDMVIDLGSELSGQETTVIDLSSGVPQLVREGIGDPSAFLDYVSEK